MKQNSKSSKIKKKTKQIVIKSMTIKSRIKNKWNKIRRDEIKKIK
jgi:hypothetical protein